MTSVIIDGESLGLDDLARVACEYVPAKLSQEARRRMRRSRAVVDRALETDAVIYGVTTGFGKLSDVRIPHEKIGELQVNLLRSHACGVGKVLSEPETRAAVAAEGP